MQNTLFPLDDSGTSEPSTALVVVKPVQVIQLPTNLVVTVVAESTMKVIDDLAKEVDTFVEITTADQANAASMLLGKATELQSEIEKSRKLVKEPYYQAGKKIDEAAAKPKTALEQLKDRLKALIQPYSDQVERERKAAERRQQEELEKIRKQQREAQEALDRAQREAEAATKRAADAEAARNAAPAPEAGAPAAPVRASAGQALRAQMQAQTASSQLADLEAKERSLSSAPVAAPAKVVGVRHIKALEFTVTDVSKVPEELLMPRVVDLSKVRRSYCVGWKDGDAVPEITGLKFEVKSSVRSS